jgi:penicillin-binding protein-related factor A (putative recombinase)
MLERNFVTEIGQAVRACGGWWHKLQDPVREEFEDNGKRRRYVAKRPFDGIAVFKGLVVFVEAKVVRQRSAWGPVVLAEHQRLALRTMAGLGHRAYVVVRIEPLRSLSSVYAVEIGTYDDYLTRMSRKSVSMSALTTIGVRLERIRVDGVYVWDVRPLAGVKG